MNTNELVSIIKNHFNSYSYTEKESTSLISPAFLSSFNLSAAHYDVNRIANYEETLKKPEKWYMFDRILRHTDMEKVGIANYCSFFEMFANVVGAPNGISSKEEIIEQTCSLLTKKLAIPPKKILITVFDGGYVKNKQYPPDTESTKLWKTMGIPEENIIKAKGHKNFVYLTTDGEQAGPRCEIYFDRGVNVNKFSRFLEIGTTVFETHKFSASKGGLVPINNFVFGNAFGMDRLSLAVNNHDSIYDTDTLQPLIKIIHEEINNDKFQEVFASDINIIADHVRGVMFAVADGQEPDGSRRGAILKKILKTLTSQVKLVYIENEIGLYRNLLTKICEIYKDRYPELYKSTEKVINILSESRQKGIFKPDSTHM